ncbi:extracellular solute-binding protein [Microbacterium sp. AGC85]
MRTRTTRSAAAIAGLGLIVALASCSGSPAPADTSGESAPVEKTEALTALVEEAEAEGALTITWALFPDAASTKLAEAFKKEYDLDIPVRLAFESNIDTLAAKLTEEAGAGVSASSDLFLTTAATAGTVGNDLIAPQDWASFSPWNADLEAAAGQYIVVAHQFPGFIYNIDRVDEGDLPSSADDVLKMDDYAIASTPYGASFNTLAVGMGGTEAVLKHLSEFAPAGLINCGEVDRIASGEFDAMWVACGKSYVDEGVREGAPLGFVTPEDGAVANSVYVGVPQNSAHPAAAALFASWLNTSTAQGIMWDGIAVDNALIEGTHSAEYVAELEDEDIELTFVDVAFVLDNADLFTREFKGAIVASLKQ